MARNIIFLKLLVINCAEAAGRVSKAITKIIPTAFIKAIMEIEIKTNKNKYKAKVFIPITVANSSSKIKATKNLKRK